MHPHTHTPAKFSQTLSLLRCARKVVPWLLDYSSNSRTIISRLTRFGAWVLVCTLLVLPPLLALTPRAFAQFPPPVVDAPGGLRGTPGKAQIALSWNSVANATMYSICKSDIPSTNSSNAVCVDSQTTSFTWTAPSVLNGATYYFAVAGKNSGGAGPLSAWISVKLVLDPPNVSTTPSKAQITVSVSAVGDADKYRFCKSDSPGGANVVCIADTAATSYTWTFPGVMNGLNYNFFAFSVNASGKSDQSNTVTTPLILAAPTGVTPSLEPHPLPSNSANAYLNITWGSVADADTYRVCWQTDAIGTVCQDNVTGTSYSVTSSIFSNRTYVVQVRGQNAAGPGYWSAGVATGDGGCPCTRYCNAAPFDHGGSGSLFGASYPDPVNLATGRESYKPDPDLTVYNPSGTVVVWQRQYYGDQAVRGYSSPGLSAGWVHTYDLSLRATTPGAWGDLNVVYQSGASEALTPVLGADGQPTGVLNPPAGSSYSASGVPGVNAGEWQSVTVTWADQTQWRFTPFAGSVYALTRITNRMGGSVDLSWGGSRALLQISDESSGARLLNLSYAGDGRLAAVTDAYGRKVTYTFGAYFGTQPGMLQLVSQIVAATEPNPPARATFTYTGNNGQLLNTASVPSPTGSGTSTATINYDVRGRVTSLVDANNNKRVYTYNAASTLVQVKDTASVVVISWTQKFNADRRDTGITDANNKSTTVAYTDPLNPTRPTSITDKNGKVLTYTYDQYGNVRTLTTPRGVTTTYTYDYTAFALGRLTSVQEGTKPATTFTYYEPSGLVQSITSASPTGTGTVTTTLTYDALGNVVTVVAPGNNAATSITTTYNYTTDGAYSQAAKVGQPLTVTDSLGHTTHLRYDAQGRLTSATDALGNETDASYNLVGQVEGITFPATGQTGTGHSRSANSYLYAGGPPVTATVYDESNAQVRQITYAYGLEGEPLSVAGSTEPVTYAYDALYRLKTLKDGNNNQTTYSYNSVGSVSSVQMPGGETIQFPSYDSAGHLLQRIDGNNVTTNYLYADSENQLTDIQYPATPSLNVHLGYDAYGRRNSMTDATGSHSYVYGNADELQSVTTTYTGLPAQTIAYAYYANGSRQSMTTPSGVFNYSYDAAARPAGLTNPFGETSSWTYFDNNLLHTQTLGNSAQTTYTYNALGQLTDLVNTTGGGMTLSQFTSIAHDGAGNSTSLTASIPAATTLSGTTTYQYDAKDQLTQEQTARGGGYTDTFGYDSAGNPTSFKGATKTYNTNNQQTGTGFTHDGNGNPTTYNGNVLTFNPENRLTADGSVLTAGYRGDAMRAWKQTASGRTYFLYDGNLPVVELDAGGSVVATNSFGANGLLSRRASAASTFYTFDQQGSIIQRLDSTGATLSSHLFRAHGAEVTGASTEPFGYGGQWGYYTDSETGLILMTFRYYDPRAGRFLARDPIGYSGGINLYSYVENNPTGYIDPYGLDKFKLPSNPGNGGSNLPPGWKPDPSHKDPNGERWIAPSGKEGLDFNKGRPGEAGYKGEDHWHIIRPDRRGRWDTDPSAGDRGHLRPGDEVDLNSCMLPRPPVRPFGPLMEELRLQEESQRAMERFWGTIFWGTAGGGTILGMEMLTGPPGAAVALRALAAI